MGNNGNKGDVTKGWKQVIEKWHSRREDRPGSVLVLHHAQQVDITMLDAYTGRWYVTVPVTEYADALVALMARGGSNIDLVAVGTTVTPPGPRGPNPPPPPGHPLIAEMLRAIGQIRTQVQIDGVQAAIEKMNAAGHG